MLEWITWIQALAPAVAQLVKMGGSIAELLKAVAPLVPPEKRAEIYAAIVAAEAGWRAAPGPTPPTP